MSRARKMTAKTCAHNVIQFPPSQRRVKLAQLLHLLTFRIFLTIGYQSGQSRSKFETTFCSVWETRENKTHANHSQLERPTHHTESKASKTTQYPRLKVVHGKIGKDLPKQNDAGARKHLVA